VEAYRRWSEIICYHHQIETITPTKESYRFGCYNYRHHQGSIAHGH
jgi:hypothetical protein